MKQLEVGDYVTIAGTAVRIGAVCRITRATYSGGYECDYELGGVIYRDAYLTGYGSTRPATPEEILRAKLLGL